MVATGNDFEELRNLARSQDASKQAQLAQERANAEKLEAKRRAAQDAKEKAEREKARHLLKLREEQKRRREQEEDKLAAQKKEWQRQRKEKLEKAAQAAKVEKSKVVTKKMISQKEKVGLGRSNSAGGKSGSTSSYEHLPLTRQEKRDRRDREALGMSIKQSKAAGTPTTTNGAIAGPSRLAASSAAKISSSPSSSPLRQPSKAAAPSKASSPRQPLPSSPARHQLPKMTTPSLQGLEAELAKAQADREHYEALSESKENLAKLKMAEANERDLRRRVAMERKRLESKQLAKIRSGVAAEQGRADDEESQEKGTNGAVAGASRPETARERFVREEAERKAAASAKGKSKSDGKVKASKKSMEFDESLDEESEDDEDEDDDDDGFIDDGEDEGQYDIWSIMNPGKDKSKYYNRAVHSDDEDDMEADADEVWREEMRSARQAREDDRREEELLRKHDEEKAARKRQKLSNGHKA